MMRDLTLAKLAACWRGELWLGAAEGDDALDWIGPNGYTDRVAARPLLGGAHGPRLLELLNAACG